MIFFNPVFFTKSIYIKKQYSYVNEETISHHQQVFPEDLKINVVLVYYRDYQTK